MRVLLAGATGVLGIRLVPLLTAAGHTVAGMTRSPERAERVRELGAEPVVFDVFDAARLTAEFAAFAPELVMHQLTDLPDDPALLAEWRDANNRIRREATANLVAAARAAGARRMLAQSVAWELPGEGGEATGALEDAVLGFGGLVLRYGQLHGPGTFHEDAPPDPPRIHVDAAAQRTVELLDAPSGIIEVVE